MDRSPPTSLWLAALVGMAVGGAELVAALLRPHPLDPSPGPAAVAGVLGMAGLFAGLARLGGPRAAGVVWALIWIPELARLVGQSPWWGLLALLLLGLPPRAALLLGGLGSVLLPLLRPLPALPPAQGPVGPLLVTVDTVRSDAGLVESADLEALGCQVGTAVSHAPWTLPALASLWTGLPPLEHGAGVPVAGGWSGLAPGEVGLGASMAVSAVLSNPHLRAEVGFGAGIAALAHADDARHPLLLVQVVLGWRARLGGGPTPWDADRDRRVAEWALALLEREQPGGIWVHLLSPHEHARHDEGLHPRRALGRVGPAAYRNNLAWTADRVAVLVQAGLAGGRAVLVVADHGESFGEDGDWGHGTALTAEQLLVPAALCRPGGTAGALPPELAVLDLRRAWLRGTSPERRDLAVPVGGLRSRWVHGTWPNQTAGAPVAADAQAAPMDTATRVALEQLGYLPDGGS